MLGSHELAVCVSTSNMWPTGWQLWVSRFLTPTGILLQERWLNRRPWLQPDTLPAFREHSPSESSETPMLCPGPSGSLRAGLCMVGTVLWLRPQARSDKPHVGTDGWLPLKERRPQVSKTRQQIHLDMSSQSHSLGHDRCGMVWHGVAWCGSWAVGPGPHH